MSKDARNRIRINRENEDKGLRDCLATPTGRQFIWWMYRQCGMRDSLTLLKSDGDASALMTMRAIGKQIPGRELENRCKLVDHRNWLIMLAENDEALDDGRAEDQEPQAAE